MQYSIRNGKYYLFLTLKNPVETEGVFFGEMWGSIHLSWLILHPSGKYWVSLQESTLNTLVQMLKSAVIAQLYCRPETDQSNSNVENLLEVMKKVYKVRAHL